jgi:predicted AlkP superfamily pyrophosphatase or phosphodiesterase
MIAKSIGRIALSIMLLIGSAGATRTPVILISIDGFRADYIDRGLTPTLAKLSSEGAHAHRMRPSFPSVTEPNHFTLVTGLRPDRHGIVDNTMIDPKIPGLRFGGPHSLGADDDPRWWMGATPIWESAERAGIPVASAFWPGDSATVHGVRIRQRLESQQYVNANGVADQILAWLDQKTQPGLILAHFDLVDSAGHLFGPDSPQVNLMLGIVDRALSRMVGGLKARNLYDRVNIIVVSDHGMAATSPARSQFWEDLVNPDAVTVTTTGATFGVDPKPSREREVEATLLRERDHLTCWRKNEIPARLHYGTNRRVPAIFCLADLGWLIVSRGDTEKLAGDHGYDPALPEMAALFVARGPAFRPGVTVPDFDNVDIYFLLARLLDLTPRAGDGQLKPLRPALR